MKKIANYALIALCFMPFLQASWFDGDHEEFTVRTAGVFLCLYGAKTMASMEPDQPVSNILKISAGLTMVSVGALGTFFAKEVVSEYNKMHDLIMEAYFDEKMRKNPREYTLENALNHAYLKLKNTQYKITLE